MTKEDFIKDYRERALIVIDDETEQDEIDDPKEHGWSSRCLKEFMDDNPDMIKMFNFFNLKPCHMISIVLGVGGAEISSFDCIYLFDVMKEVVEKIPDWKDFMDGTQDPAEILTNEIHPGLRDSKWGGTHQLMEAEELLGQKIHIAFRDCLQSHIDWPPTGDDTYFDYYPGDMEFHMAILSWYLREGPRMV